jgi:hypothetical protein
MTLGTMGTDREERINYPRMREYRLARAKEMMEKHGIGCLLTFDAFTIRYISGNIFTPACRGRKYNVSFYPVMASRISMEGRVSEVVPLMLWRKPCPGLRAEFSHLLLILPQVP